MPKTEPGLESQAAGVERGGVELGAELVERPGGQIRLESEPGKGATFILDLPIVEAASNTAEAASPTVHPSSTGLRILVIDDEPQIRRALRAGLERSGCTVFLAERGEEGLDLAALHPPDVVILDLAMPVMDGFEVCRQLREWSQVPIIVLSVRESETDKIAALKAERAPIEVVVGDEPFMLLPASARKEHVEDRGMGGARQALQLPEVRQGDARLSPCWAREGEPPRQRVVHGDFLIGTPDVKPDTS